MATLIYRRKIKEEVEAKEHKGFSKCLTLAEECKGTRTDDGALIALFKNDRPCH